jgi:hypothetical protein
VASAKEAQECRLGLLHHQSARRLKFPSGRFAAIASSIKSSFTWGSAY